MNWLCRTRPPRPASLRAAALAMMLCCAVLVGCRSAASRAADADADPNAAAAAEPPAKTLPVVRSDVSPPSTLPADDVGLLTGESLRRARTPLAELMAKLELPDNLVGEPPARTDANATAPTGAVKRYVAARDAYQRREFGEAIALLNQVVEADPDAAQAYELLGRVYIDAGDTQRGLQAMREALRRDAGLPVALFVTGRMAFETDNWGAAAALLARARRTEAAKDPGLDYAAGYFLGQSLLRLGYEGAAVTLLDDFLRGPERFARSTRMYRQVASLQGQRGLTALRAGDACLRLGRLADALDFYRRADEQARIDGDALLGRRLYADLLAGQPEQAQQRLRDELAARQATETTVRLVGYVADHGGGRRAFAQDLRRIYRERGAPERLAEVVLAALGDEPQAVRFAVEHLEAQPSHVAVYERLVDAWLESQPQRLVELTIRLIGLHDDHARRYAQELLAAGDPDGMRSHVRAAADPARSPAAAYLLGAIAMEQNDPRAAQAHFARAQDLNPDMLSAQVAGIEVDLAMGRHVEAARKLESLASADQPRLRLLRALAEFGRGEQGDALAIMQSLVGDHPRDTEYLHTLARMYLSREQPDPGAAEAVLLRLLGIDPTDERAYAMLFGVYDHHRPNPQKYRQLLGRARQHIPNSRVTQLQEARLHAASGRADQAERALRQLLERDPGDEDALRLLVALLGRDEQWERAHDLLVELMDRRADNPAVLNLYSDVCRRLGRISDYYARAEAYLADRDPTPQTLLMLGELRHRQEDYAGALAALDQAVAAAPHRARVHDQRAQNLVHLGRHQQAIDELRRALEAGVDHPGELTFVLARTQALAGRIDAALATVDRLLESQGARVTAADAYYELAVAIYGEPNADAASEQILQRVLKIDPDHAPSLNNLAYAWVEAGRNLAEAERMLRKAVASERNNAAYLDSLGWALYKQGEFDEAVQWLGRARRAPGGEDPVIVDHLGDALWRQGETRRATRSWRDALHGIRAAGDRVNRDHLRIEPLIEQKLSDVEAGDPPEVAPIGEAVGEAADDDEPATPLAPLPAMQ